MSQNHATPTPAALAQIACDAARGVGPGLKAAFRSQMEIAHKRDLHDPVTVHDRTTEISLRKYLLNAVPGSIFVGEEDGRSGQGDGTKGQVEWIVDPIDGTANFAGGLAFWCVSIGVAVDGDVVAGAVFDPMSGHMFHADDCGAWVDGQVLRPASRPVEGRGLLLSGFPSSRDIASDGDAALYRYGRLLRAWGTVRRPGSTALNLCHVAAGWADAAFGFGANAWDVSAGMLIVRRAGGTYRTLQSGLKCDHDQDCPGYLAFGPDGNYPVLKTICHETVAARDTQPT